MRALATLIFVFGAVAIAYAIHWSRKAVATVNDASIILTQTGSITQTRAPNVIGAQFARHDAAFPSAAHLSCCTRR
jgi:hypothetical protein